MQRLLKRIKQKKTNKAVPCIFLGRNGAIPTVNETVAVLGVPNKGPIVAWINTINTTANPAPKGFQCHKPIKAWVIATANTDNKGSNTPVIKIQQAVPQLAPASWPKCNGKIRLPAPKNKPNSKEATTR